MIIIQTWAALEHALLSPLDPRLRSILALRRDQLAGWGDIAHFIIVQPGDKPEQIEPPPLINLVDGCRYGDPAFEPSWEHIQDHGGWFELTYILSDDGFGHIIFIPDAEGIDPELLSLCRTYCR